MLAPALWGWIAGSRCGPPDAFHFAVGRLLRPPLPPIAFNFVIILSGGYVIQHRGNKMFTPGIGSYGSGLIPN